MRHESRRRSFSLHFRGGFAKGQRLCLREEIGRQQIVMLPHGIERPAETDEVAWDQPRALMD